MKHSSVNFNNKLTDPGLGPSLSYTTESPMTVVQCRVHQVYPEPRLELSVFTETAGPGHHGLRWAPLLGSVIKAAQVLFDVASCCQEPPERRDHHYREEGTHVRRECQHKPGHRPPLPADCILVYHDHPRHPVLFKGGHHVPQDRYQVSGGPQRKCVKTQPKTVSQVRKPKTRENISPDELKSGNQIQGDWNSLNSRETLVRKFLNKEYYLQSFPGYKFLDQSTFFRLALWIWGG